MPASRSRANAPRRTPPPPLPADSAPGGEVPKNVLKAATDGRVGPVRSWLNDGGKADTLFDVVSKYGQIPYTLLMRAAQNGPRARSSSLQRGLAPTRWATAPRAVDRPASRRAPTSCTSSTSTPPGRSTASPRCTAPALAASAPDCTRLAIPPSPTAPDHDSTGVERHLVPGGTGLGVRCRSARSVEARSVGSVGRDSVGPTASQGGTGWALIVFPHSAHKKL